MSFIFQKLFTGSILSYDSGKQFPLKTDPERKESFMSKMVVSLNENSYPIYIEHHLLSHLSEYLDSNRRYVIIADDGIPRKWVDLVSSQIPDGEVLRFAQEKLQKL